MRILLADSVQQFFATEPSIPEPIEVEWFSNDVVPSGDYVAIMPDITRRITRTHLERLPNLRIVANYGAGYDNIDIAAARSRGIAVSNTPGALTGATAELTWALILATVRRIGEGERQLRAGEWKGWQPTHMLGTNLDGKILGIVGAGRIGREVGRRASAFGMEVLYNSRTAKPAFERESNARLATLEHLLQAADVVTLHVALTAETRHLIGEPELRLMKPTSFLINTTRGSIVDQPALIRALQERRIRAAGLDVYDGEPAVPPELTALENVVLLPHLGSATEESRLAMWKLAWKNLLAGIRGEPIPNPVL
jgi:glyoxylate reductase